MAGAEKTRTPATATAAPAPNGGVEGAGVSSVDDQRTERVVIPDAEELAIAHSRWYDYSRARDAMFEATHTAWAPWFVANTDDKKRGRLNIITHLLSQIPYEPLEPKDVKLPRRQARGDYVEPEPVVRRIPTPF